MRERYKLLIICCFLFSCKSKRLPLSQLMQQKESGLVQEKFVGNTSIRLTYLPLGWEKLTASESADEDQTAMAFRISVFRGSQDAELTSEIEKKASYGVDTLFQLILNHDTLQPLSAERIANGNIGGITYLVTFERRSMTPVEQAAFVYKDWLFTNTRLIFPLRKETILIADSLSHRL